MKLNSLQLLYNSMVAHKIDRYRFDFQFNKVIFDVFFFSDELPYVLAFGVRVRNFYFEIDVSENFEISPYLREKYSELCSLLGLKFDPNNPFKPSYFFEEFNRKIPREASEEGRAQLHRIALYREGVEESDKRYFMGWRNNIKRGQQVRPINLDKTRLWLGEKAFSMCQRKNISSMWTDDERLAVEFHLPD